MTGNQDVTVDRHYHWAVLLLWPVKKRTAVKGGNNMVKLFDEDVKKDKKAADIPAVAKDIMREMRAWWISVDSYMQFLQALLVVGNAELIFVCLDIVPIVTDHDPCFLHRKSLREILPTIGNNYGWDILKPPFKAACCCRTVNDFCQFC